MHIYIFCFISLSVIIRIASMGMESFPSTHVSKIFRNSAARIITFARHTRHSAPLFKQLGIFLT